MKYIVIPEDCFRPEQLNNAIKDFVENYNHQRYHKSLQNLTPSDVHYAIQKQILPK